MKSSPKPLNLYFVNVDFPPVGGPGVWRIMAFAKYAAMRGHRVTVFCSDRASWHDRKDATLLLDYPETVQIVRVPSLLLGDIDDYFARAITETRSSIIRKILEGLRWRTHRYWPDSVAHWAIKTAFHVFKRAGAARPDCIITTGPSHLSHLSGYISQRFRSIPWIMDYRDPWTDFDDYSQINRGPYQLQLFSRIEKRFFVRANAITVVSPSWLALLTARIPDQNHKFHLLRNGHDLSKNIETMPPRLQSNNEKRHLHIHFNGTIQSGNDILLQLAAALAKLTSERESDISIKFSFCGLSPSIQAKLPPCMMEEYCDDYGPLDHMESVVRCFEADAVAVFVREGHNVQAGTIPGKTYEAMALGLYVFGVLPPVSDTRALLEEYGHCTLASSSSVPAIAEALRKLYIQFRDNNYSIPKLPQAKSAEFFRIYSRASQTDKLLSLIQDLSTSNRI